MTRPTMEELRQRVGSQSNARGQKVIYAGVPGTGPTGETCRTCNHLAATGNVKRHYKCGLTKYTHGDATTIKVRTPACDLWERVP